MIDEELTEIPVAASREPLVCPVCGRESRGTAACYYPMHDTFCISYVHGGDEAIEICHTAPRDGA